jgi:hypothetical protein
MRRLWLPALAAAAAAVVGCDPPQPKVDSPPPAPEDSKIDKNAPAAPKAPGGMAPPKKGGGAPM